MINDVKLNPYLVGISALFSSDTIRIDNVHVWPFAEVNNASDAYRRTNLDALVMGRVDNPHVSNLSVVGAKNCIHFVQTTDGVTNKFHGANIDCDLFGSNGIYVDAVTSLTAQIANYTGQGYDSSSINSLNVTGTNNFVDVANFRSTNTGQQGIGINSSYNHVAVANPMIESWGRANPTGSQGAIFVGTNDFVTLSGEVALINGPSAGVGFEGAGNVYQANLSKVH